MDIPSEGSDDFAPLDSPESALISILTEIDDPRRAYSVSYPLSEVLFIAIYATLAGGEAFTDFEDFGHAKRTWLERYIDLEKGVPSHDTFRSVFMLIDPKTFQEFFIRWTGSLCRKDGQEIIALDGKSLRGSGTGGKPVHIVNAWASANGLSLGQLKTEEKSNEITAIPELLGQLALKGAIVTTDAMGTQKTIAQTIIEAKANYVLCLKSNHPELYSEVNSYLDDAELSKAMPQIETVEKGHGRVETRRYWISEAIQWMEAKPQWVGLKSVGKVERIREKPDGSRSVQTSYYLCSIRAQAREFEKAVRAHWGIENKLHWVLDMVFGEDACQVREKKAATNLSQLRKIAYNLLRQDKRVPSLKKKRLKAMWNTEYLDEIVTGQADA